MVTRSTAAYIVMYPSNAAAKIFFAAVQLSPRNVPIHYVGSPPRLVGPAATVAAARSCENIYILYILTPHLLITYNVTDFEGERHEGDGCRRQAIRERVIQEISLLSVRNIQ